MLESEGGIQKSEAKGCIPKVHPTKLKYIRRLLHNPLVLPLSESLMVISDRHSPPRLRSLLTLRAFSTTRGFDCCMRVHVLRFTSTRCRGNVAMRVCVVDVRVVNTSVDANVVVSELAHLCVVDSEDLGVFGSAETETGDEVHDPKDYGLGAKGAANDEK